MPENFLMAALIVLVVILACLAIFALIGMAMLIAIFSATSTDEELDLLQEKETKK